MRQNHHNKIKQKRCIVQIERGNWGKRSKKAKTKITIYRQNDEKTVLRKIRRNVDFHSRLYGRRQQRFF